MLSVDRSKLLSLIVLSGLLLGLSTLHRHFAGNRSTPLTVYPSPNATIEQLSLSSNKIIEYSKSLSWFATWDDRVIHVKNGVPRTYPASTRNFQDVHCSDAGVVCFSKEFNYLQCYLSTQAKPIYINRPENVTFQKALLSLTGELLACAECDDEDKLWVAVYSLGKTKELWRVPASSNRVVHELYLLDKQTVLLMSDTGVWKLSPDLKVPSQLCDQPGIPIYYMPSELNSDRSILVTSVGGENLAIIDLKIFKVMGSVPTDGL